MRLLLLFLLSLNSFASSSFSFDYLAGAIGIQANTLTYKRGIITYKGHQVFPIYSVNLFHPDLLLAGSALYHFHKFNDSLRLITRLHFDSTLDNPLYFTDEREEDRIRREETNELDFYFQYDFSHSSFLRLYYSKDITAHHGNYLELRARYDFRKNSKASLFQPGIFAAVGYGDSAHNEYLYGEGASTNSINNIEYGFSITSPKVIDNFWPTLKITTFEIIGDKNRNASFVKETKGFSVEALCAFKVW